MARYKICRKTAKTLVLDEATGEWKPDRSRANKCDLSKSINVVPDIKEFVSVAGHKPELITSRSQLGRHMRSNNMRQVGNDLQGKIIDKVKKHYAPPEPSRYARAETKWV